MANIFLLFFSSSWLQDRWQKDKLEGGNRLNTQVTTWKRAAPKANRPVTSILDFEWVRNKFVFKPLRFWNSILQKLVYFSYKYVFIDHTHSWHFPLSTFLYYIFLRQVFVDWNILLNSSIPVGMWYCSVRERVKSIYLPIGVWIAI